MSDEIEREMRGRACNSFHSDILGACVDELKLHEILQQDEGFRSRRTTVSDGHGDEAT